MISLACLHARLFAVLLGILEYPFPHALPWHAASLPRSTHLPDQRKSRHCTSSRSGIRGSLCNVSSLVFSLNQASTNIVLQGCCGPKSQTDDPSRVTGEGETVATVRHRRRALGSTRRASGLPVIGGGAGYPDTFCWRVRKRLGPNAVCILGCFSDHRYGSPPRIDWQKFPNRLPTMRLQEGRFTG